MSGLCRPPFRLIMDYQKNIYIYLIIVLALAFSALDMQAQVKIYGKVTEGEGDAIKPLEFATVRIGGTALGVTTDLQGQYTISAPESDTIRVIFSCIGFHEVTRQLISPKGDVVLNVKMLPKSKELQEVQFTEIRKQTDAMQKSIRPMKCPLSILCEVDRMMKTAYI